MTQARDIDPIRPVPPPSLPYVKNARRRTGPMAPVWCVRIIALYLLIDTLSYLFAGQAALGGRADELAALTLMIVALPRLPTALDHSSLRALILIAVAMAAIGAISALSNPMLDAETVLRAILVGTLIDIKIFVCAVAFSSVLLTCDAKERNHMVRAICLMIVALALFNGLLQILDLLRGTDLRGRTLLQRGTLVVPQGLFDHKYKSAFLNLLGTVALLSWRPSGTGPVLLRGAAVALLVGLTLAALSVKEIAGLMVVLTLYAMRGRGLVSAYFIALMAGIAALALIAIPNPVGQVIVDRWTLFISGSDILTVRTRLHLAAIQIAQERFPLGAGTGSFGSSPAHEIHYSAYYHLYGISQLHGGSEWDGAFLTDTFWPKVLGETGLIGFALFAGLWVWLGLRALRLLGRANMVFAVLGFFALLVVSLATPVYTYAHGAIFGGLILAMLVSVRARAV